MKLRTRKIAVVLALVALIRLPLCADPAYAGALANPLQISAVIPAGSGVCIFDTGGPYSLNFPTPLDPITPAPVSTATVTFNVTCSGINGNEGKIVIIDRMGNSQLFLKSGEDQIPYSINLPYAQNVKNKKSTPVTLTATIAGTAYQQVPAGSYSDAITINVMP